MGPPRVAGELRAGLAGPVAQGDHVVEPAAGEGVQVPGALAGDVDAECSRSTRTACGCMRGLGWVPALVTATWSAGAWRSRASAIGERALLPVHTNSTAIGAAASFGPAGAASAQRRVQRGAGAGQRLRAAVQVQVVVAVPAVEAAARGGDQSAVAQQPQVVGDQVLRLAGLVVGQRPGPGHDATGDHEVFAYG